MSTPNAPAPAVTLVQQDDYRFLTRFEDGMPMLATDEPPPLGHGTGPSPVQLLCAAVGNCLAASLLFSLRKFKQTPEPLGCAVRADVGRNEAGRVRVLGLQAELSLGVPAASLEHLDRVLATFEEYCTVTQSVRQGLPVLVSVRDAAGRLLHGEG